MAKYYGKKCGVCSRPINGDDHPEVCNRCTSNGWVKSPNPDPNREFGFFKLLWVLMFHKPYQRLTNKKNTL